MEETPLLHISNLSVSYDKKTVVTDVNIAVESNEIVGIVGENGSGKTTILRSVADLLPSPDISSIIFEMASLVFIGLSVQRPSVDWGLMMSEAQTYIQLAPLSLMAPGATLLLAVITFNLFEEQLCEVMGGPCKQLIFYRSMKRKIRYEK